MRVALLLSIAVIGMSACSRTTATAVPAGSPSSASTRTADEADANRNGRGQPARGPRKLNGVPPGHYPKPGECRIWHSGRPPGQQPKPTACANLKGRVPAGSFILYGDRAFDSQYDWAGQARRESGTVPSIIVDLIRSMQR